MKFIKQDKWYNVDQCLEESDSLFIFGDNTIRKGKGGQAQIRDCKNSFGIATKLYPSMKESSFFDDSEKCFDIIDKEIDNLKNIISTTDYKTIVFPADGLGTGLSDLQNRAPKLLEHLNKRLVEAFEIQY